MFGRCLSFFFSLNFNKIRYNLKKFKYKGFIAATYDYLINASPQGLDTEKSYQYQSGFRGSILPCKFNSDSIGAVIIDYVLNKDGEENSLMYAVATVGPISACIYVSDNFINYKSGTLVTFYKIKENA